MAQERHPSDGSVGSDGHVVKEVDSNGLEITPVDTSPRPSTAPTDPNAPLKLNEVNSIEHTAYRFSSKKKWAVLTVVALCQTSMSE